MKYYGISLLVSLFLVRTLLAEAPKESPDAAPPERATIIADNQAYEAAYAKGDSKALSEMFSEDAEFTSSEGRVFVGRPAILGVLRAGLLANKGSTLAIAVDSVKLLAPEVVLDKGSTTVRAKDGTTTSSLYTAIHLKKDGKWKISQLIENPVPDATAGEHLSELAWLIGTWAETDKSTDLEVQSQFLWARGGNFITRNVNVKRTGETTLEGWQIIGWDPNGECIRSWTFDSAGGYAEGTWTRDGNQWLVRETGVAADGSRTTADNTYQKVNADRFTWESNNRTLDGDPQPSIGRVEINRVKGN